MIDDPYATHLPVLREIGAMRPIRRVLEFGAGMYSTPLFLDRTAFPDLEVLVSVEDDWDWLQRIKADVKDRRLALRYGDPMTAMAWVDVEDYDLILIDNGRVLKNETHSPDRAAVIRAIGARKPPCIVVIHDMENPYYREAAQDYGPARVFTAQEPFTAVYRAYEVEA